MDLAVAPDGSAVYLAARTGAQSVLEKVGLPLVVGVGARWTASLIKPLRLVTSITVTRDGATVYAGGNNGISANSDVEAFNSSTGGSGANRNVPLDTDANGQGGLRGLALTPDGTTLLASGQTVNPASGAASDLVYPLATAGLVLGAPSSSLGTTRPIGPESIAVTPDQAPVANLSPASGTSGSPVVLNASSSNVAYGSIVNYAWRFGDGVTATTSGPTVSHVYGAAGSYTARVTETDSAGTSLPPAPFVGGAVNGPGTTPYLHASNSAQISAPVAIGTPGHLPPPPTTTPGVTPTTPGSTTSTTKPHTSTTTKKGTKYHPSIKLVPTVGSPGAIVTVTGQGFPPNMYVVVSWSPR